MSTRVKKSCANCAGNHELMARLVRPWVAEPASNTAPKLCPRAHQPRFPVFGLPRRWSPPNHLLSFAGIVASRPDTKVNPSAPGASASRYRRPVEAVSYTHLTLPTNREV